jgi:hypothetical protein
MDTPKPGRRLWPAVVALLGAAAIAGATAGAASSDDGTAVSPASGERTERVQQRAPGRDCPEKDGDRRPSRQTTLDPV